MTDVVSRETMRRRQLAAEAKRREIRNTNPNCMAMWEFCMPGVKLGVTAKYIADKYGGRYPRTVLSDMSVEQVTKQFGPIFAYERQLIANLMDNQLAASISESEAA